MHAVIVDDDDDARGLLLHILEAQGATATAVSTAEEALVLIERSPPDVLLSDLSMPNVDGYGLIRRLRTLSPERGGRIPAIAVTAFTEVSRARVIEQGFSDHVSKPIDPARLIHSIRTAVHSERAET